MNVMHRRLGFLTGIVLAACLGLHSGMLMAQTAASPDPQVKVMQNLAYKTGDSLTDYEKERCKLDIYMPAVASEKKLPVVVWFYGGGLEGGRKESGEKTSSAWVTQSLIVVVPNYRLSPKAKYPAYLDDAAASVACTFKHIAEYGGDPKNIFITGHSAGGYLSAQIAFDPQYLAAYGIKTSDLAGTMPISGQMFTHFTIRKERGVPNPQVTPIIDADAPVYHINKNIPPTLLIIGDHDWPARLEETQYLMALAKLQDVNDISLKVVADRNHGTIMGKMVDVKDPGFVAMLDFMRKHAR